MNNTESVTKFLQTRRSTPPALLGAPFPSKKHVQKIAEMGLRVPDHKKIEPWRLLVLDTVSLSKLAKIVRMHAPEYAPSPEKAQKMIALYENAGCVIVMVFCPKDAVEGAPIWEQHLSMGAVGISLVNASIALGFGASWMSGFLAEHPAVEKFLNIQEGEKIAGFVHIGTAQSEPPERPRPNIDNKLTFFTGD